jgi:hypothetical protein
MVPAKIAKAALHDLALAFKILTGERPVPEVPGVPEGAVRVRMVADVIAGVGDVLMAAVAIADKAEEAMASLVVAVPSPAEDAKTVEPAAEAVAEEKRPYGFAAWRKPANAA